MCSAMSLSSLTTIFDDDLPVFKEKIEFFIKNVTKNGKSLNFKLGKKSLFSRKISKTPPKMVVRDVGDIKKLDSIEEKKLNWEKKNCQHVLTRAGSALG